MSIRWKLVLPVAIAAILLCVLMNRLIVSSTLEAVERDSVDAAAAMANQVRAMRGYYTKNVVAPAKARGLAITHEHDPAEGSLPLPATMVHEINELMAVGGDQNVRLFSDAPFPWRTDGGLRDDFEREAWQAINTNPDEAFWRVDELDGQPTIRYVSADLMVAQGCVDCHNGHAQTPRDDWQLGDVRGALEVFIPIGDQLAVAETNALAASLVTIVCLLLALVVVGLLARRWLFRPLDEMSGAAAALAEGRLDCDVGHVSNDELGQLATRFRGVTDYLRGVAADVRALGRGDLESHITARGDSDEVAQSLIRCHGSLSQAVARTQELIDAARRGDLDARGETKGLEGAYAELIDGMNASLAAVAEPIGEASRVLAQVAERDLSVRMKGQYEGRYAEIQNSLGAALDNLERALAEVGTAANQVSTASDEITRGSEQQSTSSQRQAASLQEISASLADLASVSRTNGESAALARTEAESARVSAEGGASRVSELSESIGRIKAAADDTARVVKTIDEIAFQTNLLALNAAVEAARAGEAGRGFAVVAEEVRALALRAGEATRSSTEMIEESRRQADSGVALQQEVSEAFSQIVEQVHRVVASVEAIAEASVGQADGVAEMSATVDAVTNETQRGAATTEESTSAAHELNAQARALRQMVDEFHVSPRQELYSVAS